MKRLTYNANANLELVQGAEAMALGDLPPLAPFVLKADASSGESIRAAYLAVSVDLSASFGAGFVDAFGIDRVRVALSLSGGSAVVLPLETQVYPASLRLEVAAAMADPAEAVEVPAGYERVTTGLSAEGDLFLPQPGPGGKLPESWLTVEMDEAEKVADGFFCLIRRLPEKKAEPELPPPGAARVAAATPPRGGGKQG